MGCGGSKQVASTATGAAAQGTAQLKLAGHVAPGGASAPKAGQHAAHSSAGPSTDAKQTAMQTLPELVQAAEQCEKDVREARQSLFSLSEALDSIEHSGASTAGHVCRLQVDELKERLERSVGVKPQHANLGNLSVADAAARCKELLTLLSTLVNIVEDTKQAATDMQQASTAQVSAALEPIAPQPINPTGPGQNPPILWMQVTLQMIALAQAQQQVILARQVEVQRATLMAAEVAGTLMRACTERPDARTAGEVVEPPDKLKQLQAVMTAILGQAAPDLAPMTLDYAIARCQQWATELSAINSSLVAQISLQQQSISALMEQMRQWLEEYGRLIRDPLAQSLKDSLPPPQQNT